MRPPKRPTPPRDVELRWWGSGSGPGQAPRQHRPPPIWALRNCCSSALLRGWAPRQRGPASRGARPTARRRLSCSIARPTRSARPHRGGRRQPRRPPGRSVPFDHFRPGHLCRHWHWRVVLALVRLPGEAQDLRGKNPRAHAGLVVQHATPNAVQEARGDARQVRPLLQAG